MASNSGQTISSWAATAQTPAEAPLSGSRRADVCIVGAGIAGLTTAYLLSKEGKSVIVLEARSIGGGQTGRTTAHLTNAIDDHYYKIEQLHGERGARLAAHSHSSAIDRIESIIREENIECDFERVDGYLFVPEEESTLTLERELKAAHRAGLFQVALVERAPLDSFDTGPALRFPRQGQFHPLKYLNGLVEAIKRNGGQIYTNTSVREIKGGTPARVLTNRGAVVQAGAVVIATNNPINDRILLNTRQSAYRTYVIGLSIPSNSVTKALYWDTEDPYHYIRTQPGEGEGADDLLIVGGEDHKTGQADDAENRYAALEAWTRNRFPMAKELKFSWSGQVMETIDGLAFIGLDLSEGPNVYIATGDSGLGMTHGTIAGILLTDLIFKRKNKWASLYDPARVRVGALPEFAREGINVATQYTDWLTGGDVDSSREIQPGYGAVVREGLKKVAIYRDENGKLHRRSAVCPHLGCIVAWNSNENTWDCPCHGSQFDPCGRVINGPAIVNLAPADD